MKNKFFYILTITVLLATVILSVSYKKPLTESQKQGPPNVVIIFMDDMGYGDPEWYGVGPYHTPNINALAMEGMRFTNFYDAQAVCSASRSALMTGCYPTRIGMSSLAFLIPMICGR